MKTMVFTDQGFSYPGFFDFLDCLVSPILGTFASFGSSSTGSLSFLVIGFFPMLLDFLLKNIIFIESTFSFSIIRNIVRGFILYSLYTGHRIVSDLLKVVFDRAILKPDEKRMVIEVMFCVKLKGGSVFATINLVLSKSHCDLNEKKNIL
uniref:Uncharacterized protein n=1 Tax=Cacopsylla melanoneura TaxID=428564 RepID=A0A8D9BUX6_9HEMI